MSTDFKSHTFWEGDCECYSIPEKFCDVVMTKTSYPDRRYTIGRDMIGHFRALDLLIAHDKPVPDGAVYDWVAS